VSKEGRLRGRVWRRRIAKSGVETGRSQGGAEVKPKAGRLGGSGNSRKGTQRAQKNGSSEFGVRNVELIPAGTGLPPWGLRAVVCLIPAAAGPLRVGSGNRSRSTRFADARLGMGNSWWGLGGEPPHTKGCAAGAEAMAKCEFPIRRNDLWKFGGLGRERVKWGKKKGCIFRDVCPR
jgi:hypothetical protein